MFRIRLHYFALFHVNFAVPKRIVGAAASEPTASKSSLAGNTVPLLEKMVTSPNAEKRDISKEETPSLDDLCRRLSTFKNKVNPFNFLFLSLNVVYKSFSEIRPLRYPIYP